MTRIRPLLACTLSATLLAIASIPAFAGAAGARPIAPSPRPPTTPVPGPAPAAPTKPAATPTPAAQTHFYDDCQQLCDDLVKAYPLTNLTRKPKIAVVEFSNLSGGITTLGQLLSEELVTKFYATGKFTVLERQLLAKAIAEHKLQLQGLVDPKSAKELGKLLDVDAIVSGTITDTGDSLRVNARLISTETGEISSVAAVSIIEDDVVKALLGQAAAPRLTAGDSGYASPPVARGLQGSLVRLPFREDFSGFKDGDVTDWGPAAKVTTGADGRKWLRPAVIGQKPIGYNVDLPENAYIEFDYLAEKLENNRLAVEILTGIQLTDETGAKYRVEWSFALEPGGCNYKLKLPGGTSVGPIVSYEHNASGTIHVLKTGNTLRIFREGDRELTANVSDFKKFTRFEVD